jgi:hypothetical protein
MRTNEMRTHARLAVASVLCAASIAATSSLVQSQTVRATSGTLTGTVHVIWRDALAPLAPDDDRRIYLQDDRGGVTQLELDAATIQAAGGLRVLNGAHVTVSGSRISSPAAPAAIRVQSLQLDRAFPRQRDAVSPETQAVTSRPYAVILCKFADIATEPFTVARAQQVIGPTYPGVGDFYSEMSLGQVNLNGSQVFGWYTLPNPRSYYVVGGTADLGKLATDCTAAADADVNFPSFAGINTQFNADLDCCSWGGGWYLNLDGVSKSYPFTWMAQWAMHEAVYGHEIGHSFGFPHSSGPYGQVYDSKWDVMSNSYVYSAPTYGWIPEHTIAFHKNLAGWIPASRHFVASATSSTVLLERSGQPGNNANMLEVEIPIPGGSEFYTLETRRTIGLYDAHLPAEAVIIHHVISSYAYVVDPDNNGNVNDAGAVWVPGETFTDAAAQISVHIDSLVGNAYSVTISRGTAALAATISPLSRRDTATIGATAARLDSARLTFTGDGRDTIHWFAFKRHAWNTVTEATGVSDGWVKWSSSPTGLAVGSYVDTIDVYASHAAGSPLHLVDTLKILALPVPLTLAVSPATRHDSLNFGTATRADSATVTLSGEGASAAAWTATRSASWTTLTTAGGTGSGKVRWTRHANGLALGVYVDTITVTAAGAAGSPKRILDTLKLQEPLALALSAAKLDDSAYVGTPAGASDSATLAITGTGATTAAWAATRNATWHVLAVSSGHGSGMLHWSRDPAGLGAGLYVDTITVTVAGAVGSPKMLVDSLRILPLPSVDAAAAELLGAPTLSGFAREYLDQYGNHDGQFDLGDLLALIDHTGQALSPQLRARLATAALGSPLRAGTHPTTHPEATP